MITAMDPCAGADIAITKVAMVTVKYIVSENIAKANVFHYRLHISFCK